MGKCEKFEHNFGPKSQMGRDHLQRLGVGGCCVHRGENLRFSEKAEVFLPSRSNCSFSRKTVNHRVSSGTSDLGSTEANVIN